MQWREDLQVIYFFFSIPQNKTRAGNTTMSCDRDILFADNSSSIEVFVIFPGLVCQARFLGIESVMEGDEKLQEVSNVVRSWNASRKVIQNQGNQKSLFVCLS